MILVTGGAGFIGSNFILDWLADTDEPVVNLDQLTYAGNPDNLASLDGDPRYLFVRGDINDAALVADLLRRHRPRALLHFAAESHVDRSIDAPGDFVRTNVQGTCTLLEAARRHVDALAPDARAAFRFVHVSTDEVYGALGPHDAPFSEASPYAPNSPYAASKAASDHLVRAWHQTYGLATLITHCSNNYGPRQFPEKLIPLTIANALAGKPLPVYGDGQQVRDWLYVGDHCAALRRVLEAGRPGEVYTIGGDSEMTNLSVVESLCDIIDRLAPGAGSRRAQIAFVADRPGHDRRYAIDAGKIRRELGWAPAHDFAASLEHTVRWYLDHGDWVRRVQDGDYLQWVERHYGKRGEAR